MWKEIGHVKKKSLLHTIKVMNLSALVESEAPFCQQKHRGQNREQNVD
jgi:Tat protein secretion system quality control protein TatD with DNase activity